MVFIIRYLDGTVGRIKIPRSQRCERSSSSVASSEVLGRLASISFTCLICSLDLGLDLGEYCLLAFLRRDLAGTVGRITIPRSHRREIFLDSTNSEVF